MNMLISEEEKKQILSKYINNTSDELLNHLKRHYPVYEQQVDWKEKPIKFILVDDKLRQIENNKKYLVGKIYSLIEEDWISLGVPIIRRTIKKYLDGISLS